MVTVSGNPNLTNPTYPTNPTNPTMQNTGLQSQRERKLHRNESSSERTGQGPIGQFAPGIDDDRHIIKDVDNFISDFVGFTE